MPGTNGAWELVLDGNSSNFALSHLGTLNGDLYLFGSAGESAADMQGVFRWNPETEEFDQLSDLEGAYTNVNFTGYLTYGAPEFGGQLYVGDRSAGHVRRLDLNPDGSFSALTQAAQVGLEDTLLGPAWAGAMWIGTFGASPLNPEVYRFDGENVDRVLDLPNLGIHGKVNSLVLFDDRIWLSGESDTPFSVNEVWAINAAGQAEFIGNQDAYRTNLGVWKGDLYAIKGPYQTSGTALFSIWNGTDFETVEEIDFSTGPIAGYNSGDVWVGLKPQGDRLLISHFYLGSWYWDGSTLERADGGGAQTDASGVVTTPHFGAPISMCEHDGYLYVTTSEPIKTWRRPTSYDDLPHVKLDPGQVATNRAELDISDWVNVSGIDWGDAEIQQYVAEQARGSTPVDIRLPNRTATIPVILKDVEGTTMEQIRRKLQAKTALFQQQKGWVERTLPTGEVVYADVVNATFKLPDSWIQANKGFETDAELTLECIPDFYGHEQIRDLQSGTGTMTWVEGAPSLAQSYEEAVLADGPVLYLRLGDPSGTTADDVSGNAHDGTYTGSPTLGATGALTGDANTAVTFNGTSQYVTVADHADLDLGDSFSLECWFKRANTDANVHTLISKGTNAYTVRLQDSGEVLLEKEGIAAIAKTAGTPVNDTDWHHLVATKSGASSAEIYLDGAVAGDPGQEDPAQTTADTSTALNIARRSDNSLFFGGTMDEVAVYDYPLSAARVAVHYSRGSAGPQAASAGAPLEGDYPGRLRLKVTEGSGNDQLAILAGLRCKHYDSAETAALFFDAKDLTPLDAAATTTLSGSRSGTTVRHNNLGSNYTPVLSTQINTGDLDLTHTGTYRPRIRVYTTSTTGVKVRLVYDVGDLVFPVENPSWTIPAASNFYFADLGEIRIDPTTGTHRWQGQIQALGEVGGENIYVDTFELVPVDEGMVTGRTPLNVNPGLVDYTARDEFNQTAAALNGKTLPVGGTWGGAIGDTDDFNVDGAGVVTRTAVSDTLLNGKAGRAIFPSSSSVSRFAARVDYMQSVASSATTAEQGLCVREVNSTNYAMLNAFVSSTSEVAVRLDIYVAGSVVASQQGLGPNPGANVLKGLQVFIDETGFYSVWWGSPGSLANADPLFTGHDSNFATGGALASGKVGLKDGQPTPSANTRTYDNFALWVPDPDAVLFADQQAELRWDGHFRQDSTGTAYGPISEPEDGLMRMPPSGMEGRPVEVYLRASRGDLDQLPDSSVSDAVSAQAFIRPSWLFLPGT